MADDNDTGNPLDPLTDNLLEDAITLSTDPEKLVAKKTVNSYWKSTLAGAVNFIPALAILTGGESISQQQPLRKPDDQLTSEFRHSTHVDEGSRMFETMVSTSSSYTTFMQPAWMTGDITVVVARTENKQSTPPPSAAATKERPTGDT